ncbi:MAG TPA: hypothetical protein VFU13_03250 [Steroidobacteraceae bacterium]|nr:hypothetical protein [Steroidobacteraceae bacterium]
MRSSFGRRTPGIALAIVLTCIAANADAKNARTGDNNVVTAWNNRLLQVVRDTNPGPPIAARALAVVHTCMYDAWAAFDAKAEGTIHGSWLRRPGPERNAANKRAAIAHAALMAAVDLFPSERNKLEQFQRELGYDPAENGSMAARTARHACGAVLKYRHADGSNQLGDLSPGAYSDYTGYRPVNSPDQIFDPARWQPLRVMAANGALVTQKFMVPHWGRVRTFALQDVHHLKAKQPAAFGSPEFLEQTREIISYSATLTDIQKSVAEYWSDGPRSETPPGHWNLLAQFVSTRDGHDVDQDVKMFFALNNAVMDAGIWCWSVKRRYDYVRPITAVRHLYSGKLIRAWPGPNAGDQWIRGENWHPYQVATFVTPPFGEYVSGHSTFSAAASEVLKRFTGSDVFGHSVDIEPGSSLIERGFVPAARVRLGWATFTDAANEAGLSRRYGGIHFRDGDLEGRRIGRYIGGVAWSMAERFFNPRRHDGKY